MRSQIAGAYDITPPAVVPTRTWDLMPDGKLAKGVNLVCRRGSSGIAPSGPFNKWCWAELWKEWEWEAAGSFGASGNWIKPQIDAAKDLVGCNVIHPIGSQGCRTGSGSPYSTPIDRATYLGHWDQLLTYCRDQGLYVYPAMGGDTQICDFGTPYGWIPTVAWLIDEYVACARLFQLYADIIIGVDLSVEASIWASNTANSLPVYTAVKAAAPKLKFTWSKALTSGPIVIGSTSNVPPTSVLDYYDVHIYYSNIFSTDCDNLLDNRSRPVMIGEFGTPASWSTASRQTFYTKVKSIAAHTTASGKWVAGSQAWAMTDQDIVTSNQYGLVNAVGTPRTDTLSIFQTFPT